MVTKLQDNFLNLNYYKHIVDNPSLSYDLITSFIGREIGTGCYRAVHEFQLDSNYVIKLEPGNTDCNTIESMMWAEIEGLKGNLEWVKDWFAPVSWISPNGKILVMKRTYDKPNKKKPEKVPSFLWDVKSDNFGWIGNKYVCHDYGQFYNFISYKKSFKNVVW